jgi:hypothetical protein
MVPKSTACKRFYTTESMKEALKFINNEGWSLYKVIKGYNIPWSTLKYCTKSLWKILQELVW